MVRPALLLSLSAMLATACLGPLSDTSQIRDLIYDAQSAARKGDADRLYKLHDLDFRATCPMTRFRSLPLRDTGTVIAVHDITVRGVRGAAIVELEDGGGRRREQRSFVKDAGRWYIYEDAEPCLAGARFAFRVPVIGSATHGFRRTTRNSHLETAPWTS